MPFTSPQREKSPCTDLNDKTIWYNLNIYQ